MQTLTFITVAGLHLALRRPPFSANARESLEKRPKSESFSPNEHFTLLPIFCRGSRIRVTPRVLREVTDTLEARFN